MTETEEVRMPRRTDDDNDITDILRIVVKAHDNATQAQSKAFETLAGELRGLRADIGRMFYFGLAGTLAVMLFLIAGFFIDRGVDPMRAAEAAKVLTPDPIAPASAPAVVEPDPIKE